MKSAIIETRGKSTFITIPSGITITEPIIIDASTTGSIHVTVEELASARIVENAFGNPKVCNSKTEVTLDAGARLQYGVIQSFDTNTVNESFKNAIIGRDATMEWLFSETGSAVSNSEYTSVLEGRGSSTIMKGIFFGSGTQEFNLTLNAIHKTSDTTSNMLTKGALTDFAKGSYNGIVKMTKDACRADGVQAANTLLLSDKAEANSVPILEIDNNDVTCSHSSGIGQLDKDNIFYMMSRGISEKDATKMIVQGFFEPLIAQLPLQSVQDHVRETVSKRI